jgi:hypothetical protein
MMHEQNMTAMEASRQAQADIRQHGITVEQRAMQSEADYAKAHLDAAQQAAQAEQEHQQKMMQAQQQQSQQQMQQMGAMAPAAPVIPQPAAPKPAAPVATPQPTIPPTGAI